MGWLDKLISLCKGGGDKAPEALTPAEVRRARLTLEQRLQRLERTARESRSTRDRLAARGAESGEAGDRDSLARRVRDLDAQAADAAGQADRLQRRRLVLVEVERMMADPALADERAQANLPALKSLDDLDRYIEAVAAERHVQAARTQRTEVALEAAGEMAAAPRIATPQPAPAQEAVGETVSPPELVIAAERTPASAGETVAATEESTNSDEAPVGTDAEPAADDVVADAAEEAAPPRRAAEEMLLDEDE